MQCAWAYLLQSTLSPLTIATSLIIWLATFLINFSNYTLPYPRNICDFLSVHLVLFLLVGCCQKIAKVLSFSSQSFLLINELSVSSASRRFYFILYCKKSIIWLFKIRASRAGVSDWWGICSGGSMIAFRMLHFESEVFLCVTKFKAKIS